MIKNNYEKKRNEFIKKLVSGLISRINDVDFKSLSAIYNAVDYFYFEWFNKKVSALSYIDQREYPIDIISNQPVYIGSESGFVSDSAYHPAGNTSGYWVPDFQKNDPTLRLLIAPHISTQPYGVGGDRYTWISGPYEEATARLIYHHSFYATFSSDYSSRRIIQFKHITGSWETEPSFLFKVESCQKNGSSYTVKLTAENFNIIAIARMLAKYSDPDQDWTDDDVYAIIKVRAYHAQDIGSVQGATIHTYEFRETDVENEYDIIEIDKVGVDWVTVGPTLSTFERDIVGQYIDIGFSTSISDTNRPALDDDSTGTHITPLVALQAQYISESIYGVCEDMGFSWSWINIREMADPRQAIGIVYAMRRISSEGLHEETLKLLLSVTRANRMVTTGSYTISGNPLLVRPQAMIPTVYERQEVIEFNYPDLPGDMREYSGDLPESDQYILCKTTDGYTVRHEITGSMFGLDMDMDNPWKAMLTFKDEVKSSKGFVLDTYDDLFLFFPNTTESKTYPKVILSGHPVLMVVSVSLVSLEFVVSSEFTFPQNPPPLFEADGTTVNTNPRPAVFYLPGADFKGEDVNKSTSLTYPLAREIAFGSESDVGVVYYPFDDYGSGNKVVDSLFASDDCQSIIDDHAGQLSVPVMLTMYDPLPNMFVKPITSIYSYARSNFSVNGPGGDYDIALALGGARMHVFANQEDAGKKIVISHPEFFYSDAHKYPVKIRIKQNDPVFIPYTTGATATGNKFWLIKNAEGRWTINFYPNIAAPTGPLRMHIGVVNFSIKTTDGNSIEFSVQPRLDPYELYSVSGSSITALGNDYTYSGHAYFEYPKGRYIESVVLPDGFEPDIYSTLHTAACTESGITSSYAYYMYSEKLEFIALNYSPLIIDASSGHCLVIDYNQIDNDIFRILFAKFHGTADKDEVVVTLNDGVESKLTTSISFSNATIVDPADTVDCFVSENLTSIESWINNKAVTSGNPFTFNWAGENAFGATPSKVYMEFFGVEKSFSSSPGAGIDYEITVVTTSSLDYLNIKIVDIDGDLIPDSGSDTSVTPAEPVSNFGDWKNVNGSVATTNVDGSVSFEYANGARTIWKKKLNVKDKHQRGLAYFVVTLVQKLSAPLPLASNEYSIFDSTTLNNAESARRFRIGGFSKRDIYFKLNQNHSTFGLDGSIKLRVDNPANLTVLTLGVESLNRWVGDIDGIHDEFAGLPEYSSAPGRPDRNQYRLIEVDDTYAVAHYNKTGTIASATADLDNAPLDTLIILDEIWQSNFTLKPGTDPVDKIGTLFFTVEESASNV